MRSLDHHIEQYRAGRFEKADSYPIGTVTFSRRAFYSEEEWRAFCEMYEGDPDEGSLMIAAQRVINTMGADASPRETPLIAAYFLWDGPQEQSEEQKLEALLEALHRKPAEADRQKLLHGNPNNPRQHPGEIEKLRRAARRVARLVRGVSIDGAPAEGLTAEDFNLARHIREQLQAGNLTKHLSKI